MGGLGYTTAEERVAWNLFWLGESRISGSLTTTLDGGAVAGAGKVKASGSMTTTPEDASIALVGAVRISGGLLLTLQGSSLAGSGQVTLPAVVGSMHTTLEDAIFRSTQPIPAPPLAVGGGGGFSARKVHGTTWVYEALTGIMKADLNGCSIYALGNVRKPRKRVETLNKPNEILTAILIAEIA
jgi:hypothetical protein